MWRRVEVRACMRHVKNMLKTHEKGECFQLCYFTISKCCVFHWFKVCFGDAAWKREPQHSKLERAGVKVPHLLHHRIRGYKVALRLFYKHSGNHIKSKVVVLHRFYKHMWRCPA